MGETQGSDADADASAEQLRDACGAGDWAAARALLDAGAAVNARDERGKTPLYFAAKHGSVVGLRLLLERGADLHAVTKKGKSILYAAAFRGSVEAVQFLLDQGLSIGLRDHIHRTALFGAAQSGDVGKVQLLVERGATILDADRYDNTPVHNAAFTGHVEIVQFFLDNGAPVTLANKINYSLLHAAADDNHIAVMRMLLKLGADVNLATTAEETALHMSVVKGSIDTIALLLEHGAHVNVSDENGRTPLYFAAKRGDVQVLQLLVDNGADLHAITAKGKSVMYPAASHGGLDAVRFLFDQGVSILSADDSGRTVCFAAARQGDAKTMKFLIDHGSDFNGATKSGQTVLEHAAYRGNVEVVKLLLDKGASATTVDDEGYSTLHFAARAGDLALFRLLVERGADVNAATKTGETVLHSASATGQVDVVEFLLDQGVDVDAADEAKRTALVFAADEGEVGVMRVLLDRGADIRKVPLDTVYFAASEGKLEAVKLLVKEGLLTEHTEDEGVGAIHYAASGGDVRFMQMLVEQGADLNEVTKDGFTTLHLAASNKRVAAARFLLANGVDVNAVSEDGSTALGLAALAGDSATMALLLEHGAARNAINERGLTLLHLAACSGVTDAVRFVLDQGLPLDVLDSEGYSVLSMAAYNNDVAAIRILIERGADARTVSQNGETALHVSAGNGSFEAVELLLDLGLDIHAVDEDGRAPLHTAASQGQLQVMHLLVNHGADLQDLTKTSHESVLHLAVRGNHMDVVTYALEQGVEPNTRAVVGELTPTALMYALRGDDAKAAYDMALALCSHGATFDANDRHAALTVTPGSEANTISEDDEASESTTTPTEPESWRPGLCACITHWVDQYAAGVKTFSDIPIEVVDRGEESVATYLADVARSSQEDRLQRCKVCVVGPSEWGKTSLVQSLRLNEPFLTRLKDRTIGIDLTTCLLELADDGAGANANANAAANAEDANDTNDSNGATDKTDVPMTIRQQLTFWDFAGQEVYQPVHTVFFSQRTLFVVVVDLEAYWTQLQDARAKPDRVCEAQLNRFVAAKIFKWVRSIFAHQPDAHFVVVGTKANRLPEATRAAAVDEIWDDLRDRLDHWKAAFAKGLDRELVSATTTATTTATTAKGASAKDIKALQARLTKLATSEWLVASVTDVNSIEAMRTAIQRTIARAQLGFPMWKTYTLVMRAVIKRRELARTAATPHARMEQSIVRFTNLRSQLVREIDELARDECEQILRTLHDLGDVLWYEHDDAGVFRDCVILDPKLVIDVVREVVRHDFAAHTSEDGTVGTASSAASAATSSPRDGRIPHALLCTFPMWKDMDVELMHAFKALLQHFQLAYPADADVMLPNADIIVPAYWNDKAATASGTAASRAASGPVPSASSTSSTTTSASTTPATPAWDASFTAHRWCWEYEIPSELSETIFVQFAVQSHSSYLPRTIQGHCVEAACAEFASRIELVPGEAARDVLRIQVAGESAELAWHNMRFYLMKMEKVLDAYGGDVVWRFIVDRGDGAYTADGSAAAAHGAATSATASPGTRHAVGTLVKAIEDAIAMGKDVAAARAQMPWMPPDMDWFLRKAWHDISSFQQLQMNHLLHAKLEVLRKLAIAGDAPRQFPALWSLVYDPIKHKAVLRMSSDLSGRCFHVPIEIDTGSPMLAKHASMFKAGVSLFATVVGNAVSLPLVQTVIDAAKAALEDKADNAARVHNLIDKLDLASSSSSSSTASFDARTSSKLSPGASRALLRDLLKAYDDSLDVLEVSDVCNLECAVTTSGEYVWAHAHELAAMGDAITNCVAPPSTWKDIEDEDQSQQQQQQQQQQEDEVEPEAPVWTSDVDVLSTTSTSTTSTTATKKSSSSSHAFTFALSVDAIEGLSDWDWHKTYCKWQLYYGNKALTPLASDVTPPNADSSQAPSWRAMRLTIEAVSSVAMLRGCRVTVQVKRRSRIGWTKELGMGEVWLREFVGEVTGQDFTGVTVHVPLDEAGVSGRSVVLQLMPGK